MVTSSLEADGGRPEADREQARPARVRRQWLFPLVVRG
jgi:hypothetical protein